MSTIQKHDLRYLKRKNLSQESNVIANWYRDIINSYGIDCNYRKLNTDNFENYKGEIDRNVLIQHAYGIDVQPDYSCSAAMVTFPEVEQDIFQLQKYGLNPQTDINFYFDSIDFACALAEKCGQFQEYKIANKEIVCEVPSCSNETVEYTDPETGEHYSEYVSAAMFPYNLGLGYAESFECGVMKGKLSVEIPGYEYGKEYQLMCDPYEHTDFIIELPANKHLSKTLTHKLQNSQYLQSMIWLTFKVEKQCTNIHLDGTKSYKSILTGKVHGGVLFYSLAKIGKYIERIHPDVGDLITIDFPDDANREMYEITECSNKSLAQDGISPLLHNYIWKCKARRYISNYDEVPENEADKRLQEKKDYQQVVDEQITQDIAGYENGEDAAYGGYENHSDKYDQKDVDPYQFPKSYEYIEDGTGIDIMRFDCGSRLITNGYELLFIQKPREGQENGDAILVTMAEKIPGLEDAMFEQGLKWLKASKECLTFTDIHGDTYKLAEDHLATQGKVEICLNSLFGMQLQAGEINHNGQCFYVFKGTKTLLWATETELYCRLESNGKLYQLA